MLKSFLKIAIRNLSKHKLYSSVNIAGLTIALTSCLLIGLYVWNELSYDLFHANADRIARVTMEYSNSGTVNKTAVTGTKVGPEFKRRFPEVESFVRTIKGNRVVTVSGKTFTENNILFADSAFFSVFSFKLIRGDASTCLDAKEKVVLSKETAIKYFGTDDALGKILSLPNGDEMIVSGVAAEIPANSQIKFSLVMPFINLPAAKQEEQWFTANYVTYLLVNGNDFDVLQRKVKSFMQGVSGKELYPKGNGYLTHHLEKLADVHLYSAVEEGLEPAGNIVYVYVLSIVAFLILLIACVNYTNLAVAQSAGRAIEVGVRKVLGAGKKQLLLQFLGESFVIVFASLSLSFILCFFLLPLFNNVSGTGIAFSTIVKPSILTIVIVATVLVGMITGLYPAILLSRKNLGMLKSGSRISSAGGSIRKVMIVFQFVASVFLIASSIIVTLQLKYIRTKELGYDKEHIIVLPVDNKIRDKYNDLKIALATQPGVSGVSGAYETPTYIEWSDGIMAETGNGKKDLSVTAIPVDLDFVATMGMALRAGRDFTRSDLLAMDTSENFRNYRQSFMINENAAAALGWTPEQAVGKVIERGYPGYITGVVKDFNFASLHNPVGPLVIFLGPSMVQQMFVKLKDENISSSLQYLERVWKQRVAHRPFEFKFLDEEYYALYQSERRTASVFGLFSGLAIFLACLGLFALAAFTTVERTKEIGIRKVLGASVGGIALLLSKELLALVAIAILISIPIAWYAGSQWLDDFAFRINLSWWMFGLAGSIAVIIAIVAVSTQAIKAAIANPVESLRTE